MRDGSLEQAGLIAICIAIGLIGLVGVISYLAMLVM